MFAKALRPFGATEFSELRDVAQIITYTERQRCCLVLLQHRQDLQAERHNRALANLLGTVSESFLASLALKPNRKTNGLISMHHLRHPLISPKAHIEIACASQLMPLILHFRQLGMRLSCCTGLCIDLLRKNNLGPHAPIFIQQSGVRIGTGHLSYSTLGNRHFLTVRRQHASHVTRGEHGSSGLGFGVQYLSGACGAVDVASFRPSVLPSFRPSVLPSFRPSVLPSFRPSVLPSFRPSVLPSFRPSVLPSFRPSVLPSFRPWHA